MNGKKHISDYIAPGIETGSGLALQGPGGRYIFFLAAPRHKCKAGELFFAGIGGHLKSGESWIECAKREAIEELGMPVRILSSRTTWYISNKEQTVPIKILDKPKPFILYEMIHPAGTQRAGQKYVIVVYKANLDKIPADISSNEMSGLIVLTRDQIVKALDVSFRIKDLIEQGAFLINPVIKLNSQIKIFPLGTARALGLILRYQRSQNL